MSGYITGLAAAGALTGDELLEVSQLSTTVTISAATISAQASDNSFNDSGSGFVATGFAVGDRVKVAGFTGDVANNLLVGVITALTAGKMTIGGTDGDVIVDDAAGETVTISKWESRRLGVAGLGGATEATASEIWTGTETGKYISPNKLFDSAAFQTLVDGATITPDFNAGLNFTVTLGGNRTLANPTNAKDGQSGVIEVVQDATGSRTLAYGANWCFPGGSAAGGVLSTAANSIDVIAYVVRGSLIYATLNKAFAA